MDEKILLFPTTARDASILANWLFSQGDMRGFHTPEGLIVFDSYGFTHSCILKKFNSKETRDWISIIFRIDGAVCIDRVLTRKMKLEYLFSENDCRVIRAIYRRKAIQPFLSTMLDGN